MQRTQGSTAVVAVATTKRFVAHGAAGPARVPLPAPQAVRRAAAAATAQWARRGARRAGTRVASLFAAVRAAAGAGPSARAAARMWQQKRVVIRVFHLATKATVRGHLRVHHLAPWAPPRVAFSPGAAFRAPGGNALKVHEPVAPGTRPHGRVPGKAVQADGALVRAFAELVFDAVGLQRVVGQHSGRLRRVRGFRRHGLCVGW